MRSDFFAWAVTIPLLIALLYFVGQTKYGKAMRATAQDPDAARLMGINVDRTIGLTFLLGGLLAGAAGLIYALYNGTVQFNQGFTAGLIAFTAAVMGGIGNLKGAVVGGLIIGIIQQIVESRLDNGSAWAPAVVFGILVLVMVFRPRACSARRRAKDEHRHRARPERRHRSRFAPLGDVQPRRRAAPDVGVGDLLAVVAILYGLYGDQFNDRLYESIIQTLAYVMMALGLNIVVGFAGLLDLGYVAFFAIGAFVAGWFMSGLLGLRTSTSSSPTRRKSCPASTSTSSSCSSSRRRSPRCGGRSSAPRPCACAGTTSRS